MFIEEWFSDGFGTRQEEKKGRPGFLTRLNPQRTVLKSKSTPSIDLKFFFELKVVFGRYRQTERMARVLFQKFFERA